MRLGLAGRRRQPFPALRPGRGHAGLLVGVVPAGRTFAYGTAWPRRRDPRLLPAASRSPAAGATAPSAHLQPGAEPVAISGLADRRKPAHALRVVVPPHR